MKNLAPVISLASFITPGGATTSLTVPPPGIFMKIGGVVNLTAIGTSDPGIFDEPSYRWDVASNNGHSVNSSDAEQFSFVPQNAGVYEIVLTVTDKDGASSIVRQTVVVRPDSNITGMPTSSVTIGTGNTFTATSSSAAADQSSFRGDVQGYSRNYVWTATPNVFIPASASTTTSVNAVPLTTGTHTVRLNVIDEFATPATAVTLQQPTAVFSQAGSSPANLIDGNATTFWGNAGNPANPDNNIAVFETATSLNPSGDLVLFTIRIVSGGAAGENLGKFRLSATTNTRTFFADGLSNGGDVTAIWTELTPVTASATSATLTMNSDRTILASGASVAGDTYTIQVLTSLANITGFRLEALTDASLPTTGPGRASNGNFQISSLDIEQGGVLQLSDLSEVSFTSAVLSPALDIAVTTVARFSGNTNSSITEGDTLSFSALNLLPLPSTDGVPLGARTYLWTVTSNNGQTIPNSTSETLQFIPSDEGQYAINLTVTNTFGTQTVVQTKQLIINPVNAAPTFSIETDPFVTVSNGERSAVRVRFADPGTTDTFSYTINWGDGTADSTGTATATPGNGGLIGTFSVPRTYATQGSRTVTVTITDNDGGSFTQTAVISDGVAPRADIVDVTPDPRATHAGLVTINFNEAVTGVDRTDFILTRDDVEIPITNEITQVTPRQYRLDLTSLTGTSGTYRLLLRAAGSGIADIEGNAMIVDATELWVGDYVRPTATLTSFGANLSTGVGIVTIAFSEKVSGVRPVGSDADSQWSQRQSQFAVAGRSHADDLYD